MEGTLSAEGSELGVGPSAPKGAVFLSYAREDAGAARRIAEALRASGLEVWFDENELRGGDAWDAKIRRQIDSCALFLPVISAHTQARAKGYFRLEWKLAVDQVNLRAEGVPFLVPVVIDETTEASAVVPAEFLRAQWMRLPGALPTPQFVSQVQALVGREGGSEVRARARRDGRPAAVSGTKPGRAAAWIAGTLGVAALALLALLLARRNPGEPAGAASANPPPLAPTVREPRNEVREFVAKALALHEEYAQDDTLRDNLRLAEQLCQRAVELDPANGEAWAAYARASLSLGGSDPANNRLEQGYSQAQRAIQLAPDSVEARLAKAEALRKQGAGTRPEAERILRELLIRAPGDSRVPRMLALLLGSENRVAEALLYADRAAAMPGGDAKALLTRANLLFRLNRHTEAEASINDALALRSTAAGRLLKMWYLMRRGELPAARQLLESIPPSALTEDRGAYFASRLWLWLGDPIRTLAVLRAKPGDYFDDIWTGGSPKGYFAGWAHYLNHQPEAAQAEWRTALKLVERRLEQTPSDVYSLDDRAMLLALTGQRDESFRAVRLAEQFRGERAVLANHLSAARVYIAAGQIEEGLDRLGQVPGSWTPIAQGFLLNYISSLRHDPEWAVVRTNPRFQSVLAALEAKR